MLRYLFLETALPITETKNSRKQTPPKYPPKPGKTHLRNHFCPLESGFSAIATYKTRIFSKPPNGPILKIFLVAGEVIVLSELLSDHLALFLFLGGG